MKYIIIGPTWDFTRAYAARIHSLDEKEDIGPAARMGV